MPKSGGAGHAAQDVSRSVRQRCTSAMWQCGGAGQTKQAITCGLTPSGSELWEGGRNNNAEHKSGNRCVESCVHHTSLCRMSCSRIGKHLTKILRQKNIEKIQNYFLQYFSSPKTIQLSSGLLLLHWPTRVCLFSLFPSISSLLGFSTGTFCLRNLLTFNAPRIIISLLYGFCQLFSF